VARWGFVIRGLRGGVVKHELVDADLVRIPASEAAALVDVAIRDALVLATRLVFERRLQHYRKVGRPWSERAQRRWFTANLKDERDRALIEAAEAAEWVPGEPLRQWMRVRRVLVILLDEALDTKPGPKPKLKAGGMLQHALQPQRQPRGRPRDVTPEQELGWMRFLYGLKLKLYIKEMRPDSTHTLSLALSTLRRDSRREPFLSPERNLDTFVSDKRVLELPKAQQRLPGKVSALAKRLQRARNRHGFELPEPD